MASPQTENGHIDIANELTEALARTNMSAYQSRILWALWRKTWGWHKKEDWISNSQFVEATGISKGHVAATLKELTMRNMVTRTGNKTAFNKDYTQWRELPPGVRAYHNVTDSRNSVTRMRNTVTPTGNKVTRPRAHKRNSSKETLQKKSLQKKEGIPYEEIISYLNQATGKNFTLKPKATIRHINARFAEGYDLEDFKTVIDNKTDAWLDDSKMEQYLRPETLFGNKFESYLNENGDQHKSPVSDATRRTIRNLQNLDLSKRPLEGLSSL